MDDVCVFLIYLVSNKADDDEAGGLSITGFDDSFFVSSILKYSSHYFPFRDQNVPSSKTTSPYDTIVSRLGGH